jgi:hypothetical protein
VANVTRTKFSLNQEDTQNITKLNGNIWIENELRRKGARTQAGAALTANICLSLQRFAAEAEPTAAVSFFTTPV